MAKFTRLGPGGFARGLTGSFAGKAALTLIGTASVTLQPITAVALGHVAGSVTGIINVTLARVHLAGIGVGDETGETMATSRILSILTRVRDTLADPNKERWSDDRLLRLLDEAQRDVAKQSKILKGTYDLPLSIGQANYTLPDDVWLITRATFDDYEIPLVSYDQQDEQARKEVLSSRGTNERSRGYGTDFGDRYGRVNWELAEGNRIESLVFDNRNINDIRVYPIPNAAIAENDYTFQNAGFLATTVTQSDSPFGVLTGVPSTDSLLDVLGVTTDAESLLYLITDPNSCNGATTVEDVSFSSAFGLVAEIEDNLKNVGFHGDELLGVTVSIAGYSIDTVYGVIGSLYDPSIAIEVFDTPYGIVTGVNESIALVRLWYIKLPDVIATLADELQLPIMFDTALKHYIIGHALRDDIDTQYRQMGAESLELYNRELGIANETNRSDGTRNAVNFNTSFRSGFE